MGLQREYKAGDIIEYDDGKLDYLMRVSDEDELGVNIVVQLSRHKFNLFIMNRYM